MVFVRHRLQKLVAGAEDDVAGGKQSAPGGCEENTLRRRAHVGDFEWTCDLHALPRRCPQDAGRHLRGIAGGRYIAEDCGGAVDGEGAGKIGGVEEIRCDAGGMTGLDFRVQRPPAIGITGKEQRLLALEAAGDAGIRHDMRQLLDGAGRAPPRAPGLLLTDHAGKPVERNINLVLDHRGAGKRAAPHGFAPIDDENGTPAVRQSMRHQRPGYAGADDDDVVIGA